MPRSAGELYLIDKDGFEYGFNADMAKHTNLYAVMRDGVRVPWTGSPPVQGGPASSVLIGDELPTEAELLRARAMIERSQQNKQADSIAMAAAAAMAQQGVQMPGSVRQPQARPAPAPVPAPGPADFGPSVEGNESEVEDLVADLAEEQGRTEPPSTGSGIQDYQSDAPVRARPAAPPAPPLPPRRAAPRPPVRP